MDADFVDIAKQFHREGAGLKEISRWVGYSISTVRLRLLAGGVEMRGTGWLSASGAAAVSASGKRRLGTKLPNEWRKNIAAAKRAAGELSARGWSVKPSGYVEITRGEHKFRGEHRVVAEGLLGRALNRTEVVHHIDRNRQNNTPSNLFVMTRAQHSWLHRMEDRLGRTLSRAEIEQALETGIVADEASFERSARNALGQFAKQVRTKGGDV